MKRLFLVLALVLPTSIAVASPNLEADAYKIGTCKGLADAISYQNALPSAPSGVAAKMVQSTLDYSRLLGKDERVAKNVRDVRFSAFKENKYATSYFVERCM